MAFDELIIGDGALVGRFDVVECTGHVVWLCNR